MTDEIVVWQPQRGPQHAFVNCPYFDVLFGGARGGGKSDACLGEFALHAQEFGSAARGVFMRREMPQADSLIDRSKDIFGPLGWEYGKQDRQWTSPEGAILRFRPLEDDRDAEKYQGQDFCVAVGTPIRMADGSLKAIESIRPGERVATLLGPRAVRAVVAPYLASCVRVSVRDESGAALGEQVHPVWHPVLTTAGLSGTHTLTKRRSRALRERAGGEANKPVAGFPRGDGQERRGWVSFSEDGPSANEVSGWRRLGHRPPVLWSAPVVLHEQTAQLKASSARDCLGSPTTGHGRGKLGGQCCTRYPILRRALQRLWTGLRRLLSRAQQCAGRGGRYWPSALAYGESDWAIAQGFPADCQTGNGFCGERFHREQESGQSGTQGQGGVGPRFRAPISGVSDTTPIHTHPERPSWVHPYTGEELGLAEAVCRGTMEVVGQETAWVADLCVEDANHYISDTGLINKNTRIYLEELTNWPSPRAPDKMKATLRSARGVWCGFRATANPGGAGHHWVKSRYIDPAPMGMVAIEDEAGNRERMFIPAKVNDNQILLDADPGYVDRLKLTGSPQLVKAWLDGDWNVIEGAFFDNWSTSRHVTAPFEIPAHWMRFRSGDWGSARPFSFSWNAVASDEVRLPNGMILPRGGIVRYREWYGAKEPNVGLKLNADIVGMGILQRSEGEVYGYSVLDPAAFAQDGGPSIAERIAKGSGGKVIFRAADNTRVGKLGHISGWDTCRHRLDGEAPDRPMFVTFDTCTDFIRTVPLLQHDPDRAEDVDTDGEDHCFVDDTLVMTDSGAKRIADLVGSSGLVRTEGGRLAAYRFCRLTRKKAEVVRVVFDNGTEVACTPDHRFLTATGWVQAKGLAGLTLYPYQRLAKSFEANGTGFAAGTFSERVEGFIGKYGSQQMAPSLMGITSITSMATAQTTRLPIFTRFTGLATRRTTDSSGRTKAARSYDASGTRPMRGTEAPKVEGGTQSTLTSTFGRALRLRLARLVSSAGRLTRQALSLVAVPSSAIRTVEPVRCVSVEPLSERHDVYCLTVPETGCFAIGNGLIVSNCGDDWRYACNSRPWTKPSPQVDKPITTIKDVTLNKLWKDRGGGARARV